MCCVTISLDLGGIITKVIIKTVTEVTMRTTVTSDESFQSVPGLTVGQVILTLTLHKTSNKNALECVKCG